MPHDEDDASANMVPEGTILDTTFKIGSRVSSRNHADVYLVSRLEEGLAKDNIIGYEARVFDFRDLPPSLKRYRIRAMNRLSARTVLRAQWGELHIIIYKTGQLHSTPKAVPGEPGADGDEMSTNTACGSPDGTLVAPARKEKTNYQRESQRLRQRDRRRSNRQRKRECARDADSESQEIGTKCESSPRSGLQHVTDMDESEYTMFGFLHLANTPHKLEHVSPGLKLLVEQYLARKDMEVLIDAEEDLEDFIKLKERDVVNLRRQYRKYQPLLQHWHNGLTAILNQQRVLRRGSREWMSFQAEHVEPFKLKYSALHNGLKMLPGLIKTAEEAVRSSNEKLISLCQARAEQEKRSAARLEREKLARRAKNYRKWGFKFVPGSETHIHLQLECEKAEQEFTRLDINKG